MASYLRNQVPPGTLGAAGAALLQGQQSARRRTHLWATCRTSISAAVGAALGDTDDTQQRAAARSGVALAMERWGCREDPSKWQWRHLRAELETFLRESPIKYLGDAWMLAQITVEEHQLVGDEQAEAMTANRVAARGRWDFTPTPRNWEPMAAEAAHWESHGGTLVFEPTHRGGLGVRPSTALLQAGVVSSEHFSDQIRSDGGVWLRD